MSESNQIHQRIQSFVTELETLVRQAAIDAVRSSLGGGAAPAQPAKPRAAVSSAPRARAVKKAGGKRDPKLIEALVARVGGYVKAHPGQGVEAIAKGLKVSTHDITLPVTKLLASKAIKKKGQKRATKYYPS